MPRKNEPPGLEEFFEWKREDAARRIAELQTALQLIEDIENDKYWPTGKSFQRQADFLLGKRIGTNVDRSVRLQMLEEHAEWESRLQNRPCTP